jgi:hypothetical protein
MHENENDVNQRIGVDTELIRYYLEMTPEQRLSTNDNAVRAIEELRNGFKKAKPAGTRS